MGTKQGSYKSILGGVSQQVYTDRQLSQVEAQDNMTSDSVRGLRKRPGSTVNQVATYNGANPTQFSPGNYGHLRGFTADLGWGLTEFIVNTKTGVLTALVEDLNVQNVGTSSYLVSSTPTDIVFSAVGSTLYIGNCSVQPVLEFNETRLDPARRGYFFVLAGAYGKDFTCIVTTSRNTFTTTYTTPDGTTTGDSAKSTPEYIAGQIVAQLNTQLALLGLTTVTNDGAYIYMETTAGTTNLNVSTSNANTYVISSNTHTVDLTTKLPARLPPGGDGFVMSVGDASFTQYFQWSASETRWIEAGEYGSATGISASTMPITVESTSTLNSHTINAVTWPGREAGNDDNNDNPVFTDSTGYGITGLASFQGRLVIFSGPYICMGSNRRDDRKNFFRTTVTQVLDDDRIEFTSTSFSGASFRYGTPFNSDLILASETHQGVIPGRTTVLTPNNATAVLTSTYQMDTNIAPQACGRSLYYAYPRSASSFSVKEMLPSGYTDSQYVSQDATDHLPTYMEGACQYIASSTTNNIVIMGSTTEKNTLYVNEYLWSGEDKVLSAWHRWILPGVVHLAWFVRERLIALVEVANSFITVELSLRNSPDPTDPSRFLPAGDLIVAMPVVNTDPYAPYIEFPSTGREAVLWDAIAESYADNGDFSDVMSAAYLGDYIGAEVGVLSIDSVARRLYLYPTYDDNPLCVGVRFTALFSPTPPRIFDGNGAYIDLDKLMVQFFNVTLRYTTPFTVTATDRGGSAFTDLDGYAIDYTSEELGLDSNMVTKRYTMRIRVGIEAQSSETTFKSNSAGDLNIQGLGYIVMFNNKVGRI